MENDSSSKYYIPRPGDRIGDNIIIESIAEGGMARIYKVKNEALEVIRVIKLMKANSDIDADRFVTEARISAKLNHPNIVQCYYFGKFNNYIPYIEMEYVEGTNLYKLIYEYKQLPIAVTLSILFYICKALYALHTCYYTLYNVKRSGIVHRDIKPANILISNDGNVKLADFGIAKPKDLSIHTSAVQIVGSTFYLSPEQLRKEPLDFRTDIYSLGCVFYEMVTAQKAFEQNNISDIVVAKLNSDYSKILLHKCPDRIKTIIAKCLNPQKEDRYRKIEEIQIEIISLMRDYAIQNPRQVIYNFIQNPESFPVTLPITQKKKTVNKLTSLTIISIIVVIALFFMGFYLFRKVVYKTEVKKENLVAEAKKDTNSLKVDDLPVLNSSEKKQTAPPVPKNARPVSKPIIPKPPHKNFTAKIIKAFNQKKYHQCISFLEKRNNLNDTLYMCYMGSLLAIGSIESVEKHFAERPFNDGYYFYLKGRLEYHNKEYQSAQKNFLKALTIRTFYPKLLFYSNYYMAKAKTALYLKTPNLQNKKIMLKSFERFTIHYCNNPTSVECNDIITLFEQYK